MVGGQAIDLQAANGSTRLDGSALRAMHGRKTGALIRAAAGAGAIMGGGSADVVGAIESFANHVGLAFQIVDDILDVEGAGDQLGKTTGKDAAAGKPTYPALYGLDESRRLAAEAIARALQSLTDAGLGYARLFELADWVAARRN